jgi:hypothetical protein
MESRLLKRRLFNSRWSPNELYHRYVSWFPALLVVGIGLLVFVACLHAASPEREIASQCQMSAGKCYPMQARRQ